MLESGSNQEGESQQHKKDFEPEAQKELTHPSFKPETSNAASINLHRTNRLAY